LFYSVLATGARRLIKRVKYIAARRSKALPV